MRFTFYRPQNQNENEFDNIVGKMHYDLHLLESSEADEWSTYCYVYGISSLAKELEKNSKMKFLGLGDPNKMPPDIRVYYFYEPTYIATAFIIKAILLYPSLLNATAFLDSDLDFTVETVNSTLTSLMLGCTGRNFEGAEGYKTSDCIKLFEAAGTSEFIEKYPNMCLEFNELYKAKKATLI